MRVSKEFIDDIKLYNKQLILKKLDNFQKEIENSNCINMISKGFWIRKIINTDIYKFRVNNGDRILFTFDKNNENELVFLKYCNHDKQILKGKSINRNIESHINKSMEINLNEYEDDEIDINIERDIEHYIKMYTSSGIENLISIVLEDEYIAIALEEKSDEYLYYLNEEQFNCLKIIGKPIIISGCAGSGKTMVGIHKLLLNNENNIKSAYITYSHLLKNQAKKYFEKFNKYPNKAIDFICINEFFAQKLGLNFNKIIKYSDFEEWFIQNYSSQNDIYIDTLILYNEITKKNIYKDTYKYEWFNDEEVKFINKIHRKYESWITEKEYIDEVRLIENFNYQMKNNKLELPKYDFIFIDEIQDLREMHLEFINNILSIKENVIFSGDINQIVNGSDFKFNFITKYFYENSIPYEEKFINKNYRNTSGVVNLINKLIDFRINKIGKLKKEYDQHEEYIRDGKKPYIISYNKKNVRDLFESANERNYCAIVVPTYEEKHRLIIEGANENRIFTINEIKGLEYKNIFCINFISSYKKYWGIINKGNNKPYLRHFFNILYVAITRGMNIVTFLEDDINAANKILGKDFLNNIKNIDVDLLEMNEITDVNGWLKEAERLEDTLDYKKAYDAYKKANDIDGMNRCKTYMKNTKTNFINQLFGREYETGIRIEKDYGALTYSDIYISIQKIFNKHYIYSKGDVDVVFQNKKGETLVTKIKNLNESNLIREISNCYEDCTEEIKNIKKNKVTIYMNFYCMNRPKRLNLPTGEEVNLIRVDIRKSNKNKSKILLRYEYLEGLNMSSMLDQLENYGDGSKKYTNNYESFFDSIFEDTVTYVNYLITQGHIYMDNENYSEAIKCYENVLENKLIDYIKEVAQSYQLFSLYEQIEKEGVKIHDIKEFEKYIRYILNYNLGICYMKKELYDMSYKYLKRSLNYKLKPLSDEKTLEYSNIYLNIGDIFISKGDYPKAYEYFEKALDEGNPLGIKGIALVNFRVNNVKIAIEYIHKYLEVVQIDVNGHLKLVEYFTTYMENKKNLECFSDMEINKYHNLAKQSYQTVKKNIADISKHCPLVKIFEQKYI